MPPEIQVQTSGENEAKALRMAEIELRRADLRKRMEEASKLRKAKKGFMTADRKKKLRLLLRRKAAEELKREQEQKSKERQWIIEDRCGDPEDLEWASKDDLIDICQDYFQRIVECESEKWDIEYQLRRNAFEIAELNTKVNDLKGKFQRPILKKVSRFENKFSLLQRKAAEYNIKNQLLLRTVRKPDFNLKDNHRDSDDFRSVISSRDSRESVEREIRHEDFTEVEVGEIPEEGEDDDSLHEEEDGNNEEPLENLEISYEAGESADPIVESNPLGESETCTDGDLRLDEQLAAELQGDREDRPESEHRLQGEPEILISEGALEVEGEQRLGGQSPEEEVQPSEHSEPSHPQHTEEDLWHYLKEAVTSERPSTVEEFLQNLIGTLQHVPEEYLEPVVAANIKRSNSPCSTDGDNQRFSGEMVAEQKEALNLEGDSSSKAESIAMPEDVTTPVEVVTPDVPAEVPNTETNATSDSEGLSSVEAAV